MAQPTRAQQYRATAAVKNPKSIAPHASNAVSTALNPARRAISAPTVAVVVQKPT